MAKEDGEQAREPSLKASYDISGFPASVQAILRALKKYGMILADTGTRCWMITGGPNEKWNDRELVTLEKIPGSAFEVVKLVHWPV